MRILLCHLKNFASYEELYFQFTNRGLAIIQGATGSGKSTLCDAIPWVLFGVTAKGGSVSEVISWPGDKVTSGTVTLVAANGPPVTVTRTRGQKSKDNDLYWKEQGQDLIFRGKDLNDTQKLLNGTLGGITEELYLSAAYFHEFSATAAFFTTTAKNRRVLCEQIVDLSLASTLQSNIKDTKKSKSQAIQKLKNQMSTWQYSLKELESLQIKESTKANRWEQSHTLAIQTAIANYEKFESNRKKVISNKCRTCNTILQKPTTMVDNSPNPYLELLAELESSSNPHTGSLKDFSSDINEKISLIAGIQSDINIDLLNYSDLETLEDVVSEYRTACIRNTISNIEDRTNALLSEHFDAEIRVQFTAEDADKLEVSLYKDGNLCVFTQLSKGQRQLLRLCFGIAVMEQVSNQHGMNFTQLFFDEALDGLSDSLKVKAHGLFSKLALNYESILIVEHSNEFKTLFDNKYTVELINGKSVINEEA